MSKKKKKKNKAKQNRNVTQNKPVRPEEPKVTAEEKAVEESKAVAEEKATEEPKAAAEEKAAAETGNAEKPEKDDKSAGKQEKQEKPEKEKSDEHASALRKRWAIAITMVLLSGLLVLLVSISKKNQKESGTTEAGTEVSSEATTKPVTEQPTEAPTEEQPHKNVDGTYSSPEGERYANETFRLNGELYYVGGDGKPAGGTHRADGTLYLFDQDGKQVTKNGWQDYKGKRYYVSESGGLMNGGTKWIDGKWYCFDRLGALQKGRIDVDELSFHYTDSNGAFLTDADFTLDNVRYHADAEGLVFAGTMYAKAQEYYSDTDYLILVNLATQKTAIFQGKQGAWMLQKEVLCSTGAPINPTPKGEYKTTSKTLHFDNHGMRAWYSTGFIGGLYLFHSLPYEIDSQPNVIVETTLGKNVSHGCVRLDIKDAKWIYDTIPARTKVVIYEE